MADFVRLDHNPAQRIVPMRPSRTEALRDYVATVATEGRDAVVPGSYMTRHEVALHALLGALAAEATERDRC